MGAFTKEKPTNRGRLSMTDAPTNVLVQMPQGEHTHAHRSKYLF